MKARRCILSAVLTAGLLGTACYGAWVGLGWAGETLRAWLVESGRSSTLDGRSRTVQDRIALREELIDALLARRTDVCEVLATLREAYGDEVDPTWPGESNDERLGLSILRWAAFRLRDAPDQDEVLACLERELKDCLRGSASAGVRPSGVEPGPFR